MTRARRLAVVAASVLVALTSSSCSGGGDAADASGPAARLEEQTASSAPTSPTTAAAGGPSASPASSGESAAVAAVRAWAEQTARAISDGDDALDGAADTMTDSGRAALSTELAKYFAGETFPGPFPFEVMGQQTDGATTVVQTCLVNDGWALAPDGSTEPTSTIPLAFLVVDEDGDALVDGTRAGSAECDAVEVEESRW